MIKRILEIIKKLINKLKGSSNTELPDEGEMNMYGFLAPYAHNYGRQTQNGFGGINANKSADNGEVLSLIDMTSDEYPLLATREKRWRCGKYEGQIVGYGVSNGQRAYVTKNSTAFKFHYAGLEFEFEADASLNKIDIAAIGDYIILMPVEKYFDVRSLSVFTISGEVFNANFSNGALSRTITYTEDGVQKTHTFKNGEIFNVLPLVNPLAPGESGLAYPEGMYQYVPVNIYRIGLQFGDMRNKYQINAEVHGSFILFSINYNENFTGLFLKGDAVKISNCQNASFNKTAVIRMAGYNASGGTFNYLYLFDENTFTIPEGQNHVTEANMIIERDIPELDFMFEHNNRVWGAKGRNIYCSKVGNPMVWSDYESLADGCWWADSGNTEPHGMTGGCSYTYPRFFTQECIFTIYGNTPGEFTIVPTRTHGVKAGSGDSLAVVNGMLVYLSPNGFMGYTGSLPQKLDYALGVETPKGAMSISDGVKYYAFTEMSDGKHLFAYDPIRGMWEEERAEGIEGLWHIENTSAAYGGHFWTIGKVRVKPIDEGETEGYYGDTPEGNVIFADVTNDSVGKKQLKEISIRHDVGGELTVKLYIDGVLDESFTKTITGAGKRTTVLPCVPKRCDHWHLELEGEGPWVIYSIAADYLEGSNK